MQRRFLCLLACLSIVTLWSCDDEDDDQIVNSPSAYILGDLVHFDADGYFIASVASPDNYPQSELWVPRDVVVGEPYTDLDVDGVYDVGRDIFWFDADEIGELDTLYFKCFAIIDTACVSFTTVRDTTQGYDRSLVLWLKNQDLNHNGTYDGPNSPWSPGVPYVDLDGDGEYDREYTSYQPGLPFTDLNENGAFDSVLTTRYSLGQWQIENYGSQMTYSRISVDFHADFTAYRYVSDSGVGYDISNRMVSGPPLSGQLFELDSVGLWYTDYPQIPLLLMEHGEVHAHSDRSIVVSDSLTEIRSISLGETLTIGENEYSNLVAVDIPRVYYTADTTRLVDIEVRFYFNPNELHLLAIRLEPPGQDSLWIYLDRRADTLPLPMIR